VGPWFATEFRCTYLRRRTGEAVDVKGALFCETREGKLAEMRMYWERRATPQSPE
jgi:ketosteroid isomerase-like protein